MAEETSDTNNRRRRRRRQAPAEGKERRPEETDGASRCRRRRRRHSVRALPAAVTTAWLGAITVFIGEQPRAQGGVAAVALRRVPGAVAGVAADAADLGSIRRRDPPVAAGVLATMVVEGLAALALRVRLGARLRSRCLGAVLHQHITLHLNTSTSAPQRDDGATWLVSGESARARVQASA